MVKGQQPLHRSDGRSEITSKCFSQIALVQSTWDDDFHVLPASPMLEGAERELTGVAGAPYRLAEPLSRIANHYAAIVIDTRPSFSLMTETGLLAATDATSPVLVLPSGNGRFAVRHIEVSSTHQ